MKNNFLGKTGLLVSEIGLGTAQIGGPSLINGKHIGAPAIEKKQALAILNTAFDNGINFYDTSDKYGDGESERRLTEAFSSKRDKVILATKCGITSEGTRCFEKEYVKMCLEKSLRNLKTDYVDIFQLTKPDIHLVSSGEIYEVLDELKKEGKVRFSGISTSGKEDTELLISQNKVDTLQIFFNLLHVEPNEGTLQMARDAEIGVIIKSPLSSGMLTGKFDNDTIFSKEDDRSSYLKGETLQRRVSLVNDLIGEFDLNRENGILHFSLNYLLSNENIATTIPGASKCDQLKGILEVLNVPRMDSNRIGEIEEFLKSKSVAQ